MDPYITVCTHDVYIPECGDQRCQDNLKKIAVQLKKHGCQCVEDYKMNGLWRDRFKENFLDCCFTLLHTCPLLCNRISDIFNTDFTSDHFNKIICVQLARRTSQKKEITDDACVAFFHKFTIQPISDNSSIIDFVQRFMKQLDRTSGAPSVHTLDREAEGGINYSGSERRICDIISQLEPCHQHEESEEGIGVYPNELGRSSGREVCVRAAFPGDLRDKLSQLSTFAQLKQHIDHIRDTPETAPGNVTFVLHQILPKLYDVRDSIGLANIAACNQATLQKVALTYLELLVLNGSIACETGKLQETEILLAKSACDMSRKYKTGSAGQTGQAATNKRMLNLILMIHCQIITQSHEESHSDDLFRSAIGQILSETSAHGCSGSNKIISIIRSLKGIQAKAEQFTECNASRANDLVRQTDATQTCVIFNCLIKIYSRLDSQVLQFVTFLKKYLKVRWLFHVPTVCSKMILCGVALFFKYSLKEAVHLEIGSVCSEVMNVIIRASQCDSDDEVNSLLRSLLFDKIPSVRHCVIDFFKRQKLYSDRKLPHLIVDEIASLLCPLLVIDPKEKLQHHEAQWWTVLGTFGHQKVVVCFHNPTEKDHWDKDSMRFIQHSDTMHLNQVSKLKNLRHPGIIDLLAYQRTSMPLFYVLEDYLTLNLQTALKNRNDNRVYFSLYVLIKFLGDVAEAVDFCHNANIAHINLTAASLFIVGNEERVKLGGFHLAVHIEGKEGKVVDNVVTEVPTRWTAPESLRRHKFSKASDIWMFGHLMYEVLTHGVLPYSHLDLADDELVTKLFFDMSYSPPVQLFPETCLKKDHYTLILDCTTPDSSERPHISTVLTKLQRFYRQSADYKPQYPNLSDGKRRPSTTMRQGIPDVFGKPPPQNIEFIKEVRSMLTQYKLNEALVFRETIEGCVSETLLSRFNDGSLDDVIPWVQHTTSTANSRVSFIDCYIPSSCGFCLLDRATERQLGNRLQNYLEILFHIATFLKNLHDKGMVLGHMCASTFFMEQHYQKPKIFVASVGYACESSCYRRPPTDRDICERAAPEVRSSGLYSTASDVFCFGHLVKEIITAFDDSLTEECPEYTNDSRAREIVGKLDHAACRYRLKQLMDLCWKVEVIRRPKMEGAIDRIMRFISDLKSDYCPIGSCLSYQGTVESRDFSHAGATSQAGDTQSVTVLKQIYQSHNDRNRLYEDPDAYRSPSYTNDQVFDQSTERLIVSAEESNGCTQSDADVNSMLNTEYYEADCTQFMSAGSTHIVASDSTQHNDTDSLTFLKQPTSCVNTGLENLADNSQAERPTNEREHCSADSLTLVKTAALDSQTTPVVLDVETTNQENNSHVYDKLPQVDSSYTTFIYAALTGREVVQIRTGETYV